MLECVGYVLRTQRLVDGRTVDEEHFRLLRAVLFGSRLLCTQRLSKGTIVNEVAEISAGIETGDDFLENG